jgi:hypothetical protein
MTNHNGFWQWLIFFAILLAIGIGVTVFAIWVFGIRKYNKKKRKRRHRGRRDQKIRTLAESGGLPPPRKPGEPPKGV